MADLSASLGIFTPTELIVFLARAKKKGCLTFQAEESQGKVFIRDGRIVHAEIDEWTGMDALLTISLFDSGSAEFTIKEAPGEETISEEWSELSEEFDRRRVELVNLKEKLPTEDMILYKLPDPVDESLSLRRSDWQVLALIDGERRLGDVVKESKLGLFDALNSLNWLIEKGLVATTQIEKEKKEEEEDDWQGHISRLLDSFFKEFAGKGAVLKAWVDKIKAFDDGLDGLFVVDDDNYSVSGDAIDSMGREWWQNNLDKFLDHLRSEGVKVFGKILGRKKWQKVEQGLNRD